MNRRIFALLVCAGLILALLASSLFIIVEADHDCPGEGCGVCEHMVEVRALLRGMAHLGIAVLTVAAFLRLACPLLHIGASADHCPPSLVCLKVRLDN